MTLEMQSSSSGEGSNLSPSILMNAAGSKHRNLLGTERAAWPFSFPEQRDMNVVGASLQDPE